MRSWNALMLTPFIMFNKIEHRPIQTGAGGRVVSLLKRNERTNVGHNLFVSRWERSWFHFLMRQNCQMCWICSCLRMVLTSCPMVRGWPEQPHSEWSPEPVWPRQSRGEVANTGDTGRPVRVDQSAVLQGVRSEWNQQAGKMLRAVLMLSLVALSVAQRRPPPGVNNLFLSIILFYTR